MASESTKFNLEFSNSNSSYVTLTIGVEDTYAPKLNILATPVNTLFQENGTVLDAPVETPDPEETNEPPSDLSYGVFNPSKVFNHLLLPRLENQLPKVFNLNIDSTTVIIDGVDLSKALYSLDWVNPINGPSEGSLLLKETEGINLDPEANGFNQGSIVEITVNINSLRSRKLTSCFVIGYPSLILNDAGTYELSVSLGDELKLLENTTRNKTLYCGLPPSTTRELAQIYAKTNGLKTLVYPEGGSLLETISNTFVTESAFDFLSAIYKPHNRDVRTSVNGSIICPKRKLFNPNNAHTLTYKDVIQAQPNFTSLFEPYTKVKNSNNFNLEESLTLRERTSKSINGDPTNTKAWFQGGYQETITTITSLGDTDIYTREITYGYIPTDSLPWSEAQVKEDPCVNSAFNTEWGVIATLIKGVSYYVNSPQTYIISREEEWKNELRLRELDTDPQTYDLFNGLVSYKITTYSNAKQVNVNVCPKDYLVYSTRIRTENYSINSSYQMAFNSWDQTEYKPSGKSVDLGQSSYTGEGIIWTSFSNSGEFDEERNVWVIQPMQTESYDDPPQAKFIRPIQRSITNFSEYSLINTLNELEPTPLNSPYCYTKSELDTVSDRYLRENYGLSRSIILVVPFLLPIEVNDSIIYTDRLGRTKNYLVYSVEYNQTLTQMTKTLILMEDYSNA